MIVRGGAQLGLNPPAVVREATAAYLAAEDALAQWLDECCVCDAAYAERQRVAFENGWFDREHVPIADPARCVVPA